MSFENEARDIVPADSAEYLEGELPKYAESSGWIAGANHNEPTIDPNTMSNPMDPSAGQD